MLSCDRKYFVMYNEFNLGIFQRVKKYEVFFIYISGIFSEYGEEIWGLISLSGF